MDDTRGEKPAISRRHALRLAGGAGAAAVLAACGGEPGADTAPTAAVPTVAATVAAPVAPTARMASAVTGMPTAAMASPASTGAATMGASRTITLPNTGAKIPTDKATFRWTDSGDSKAVFFKQWFAVFQQAHPNITMQYDGLPWTEIEKVVTLGVQNGNAPDVFQVPLSVPTFQAVQQGWVVPLEDIVPNFAQWKAAFPPNSFFEGINVFGGKTYTFPRSTSKRTPNMLFFNKEQMARAGYDPAAKRFTWDEFRAAAKKLTEQGGGKYFGFITGGNQPNKWSDTVRALAQIAGAPAVGEIDLRTGELAYTSDQNVAAIEMLLAMKADGSVFPGLLNINEAEARARMAQGNATMGFAGEFASPLWLRDNPGFDFDVAQPPAPNTGTPLPLTYTIGANHQWVFSKASAANRAVAGEIFTYLGTEAGQSAFVTITDGSDPAAYPGANAQAAINERTRRAYAVNDAVLRLGPMPQVRNPDVSRVLLERKATQPNFGTVIQGIYTGQIKETRPALKDLQDREEREFDRAIKAAQMKGAKVSRDDWKFPNWDPARDYTEADYAALKK